MENTKSHLKVLEMFVLIYKFISFYFILDFWYLNISFDQKSFNSCSYSLSNRLKIKSQKDLVSMVQVLFFFFY